MTKAKLDTLIKARKVAENRIGKMTDKQRKELERKLDVEHAYYSSALEGSKLDRKTFDELAQSEN